VDAQITQILKIRQWRLKLRKGFGVRKVVGRLEIKKERFQKRMRM